MKSGSKQVAGKAKARIPKLSHTSTSKSEPTKSPRKYSAQTLKLLWGRAAGRCAVPDCRIELFVTESGYDPVCIIGEMGHVAGSSSAGPRPDVSLPSRRRDDYQNLILLCRNCHRKLDVLQTSYPAKRLQEIKANHEAWVRTALPERGFSSASWKVVRIQGEFAFDPSTLAEALSPDQQNEEVQITVSPSRGSWASIQNQLRDSIEGVLSNQDSVSSRVAVFPLAPVSACLFAGYLLTNRVNVRAFQYHRDDRTWVWPKDAALLTSPTFLQTEGSPAAAEVFFLFQLTASVDVSAVRASVGGEQALFECSVPDPSTMWLKAKSQLDELARKAREMFEVASTRFPKSRLWHIFYAGPAPGAIAVGQQLNPTMVPAIQCYEFQRPNHIPSILITPKESLLTRWV